MLRADNLPYTLRESTRAKRVILRILPGKGLEIVVPSGFDVQRVPLIVHEKKEWIRKTLQKMESQVVGPEIEGGLPEDILLRTPEKRICVQYVSTRNQRLVLRENGNARLVVSGSADIPDYENSCHELLRCWLKIQAKNFFPPFVKEISTHTGLSYARVRVRNQKTRWGSCSNKGTISLNCKLLFLPEDLVRYVILHELCHTIHMNHSPKYWAFVSSFDPHGVALDKELNSAWRYVPFWV